MNSKPLVLSLTVIFALGIMAQVRGGDESPTLPKSKVAFPEHYAKGVMYFSKNRDVSPKQPQTGLDNIAQYREYYIAPAAIEALRQGHSAPDGTIVTMIQYTAQLDAHGAPLKDAGGRFIKKELFGFAVMEKRTGWGADLPEELRNGDWRFQAFTADGKPNERANLRACYQCHGPLANMDHLFTFQRIKSAGLKETRVSHPR